MSVTAYALALLLHHEARNQPPVCRLHVAQVVMNRVADWRWPNDVLRVTTQRHQFTGFRIGAPKVRGGADIVSFEVSSAIAQLVVQYGLNVNNATHYYAHNQVRPRWAEHLVDVFRCGDHTFGRELSP